MKKFIVLFLIVLGLSVEGANYNSMKELIFDVENAIGKTININAKVRGVNMIQDWNYIRRPCLAVKDIVDKRGRTLDIFFKKRFKKRIKELKKDQLINVTCRIKEIGILTRCDLVDFTFIED